MSETAASAFSFPVDPEQLRQLIERMEQAFSQGIPHNRAVGIQFVDLAPGVAVLRLPFAARLVGDPERGILHGGAITTLLDATCGAAVFARLLESGIGPVPVATLDLRIDYLRPAEPGRAVTARADCYKLTRHVAFVRASAYHEDEGVPDGGSRATGPIAGGEPVASATGTFMISSPGQSVTGAAMAAPGSAARATAPSQGSK